LRSVAGLRDLAGGGVGSLRLPWRPCRDDFRDLTGRVGRGGEYCAIRAGTGPKNYLTTT